MNQTDAIVFPMTMTKNEKEQALLTLLLATDDLLRNDAYQDQLEWVWNEPDASMFTAFLLENLPSDFPEADEEEIITTFFPFLQQVSNSYLSLAAEGFETPLSTRLFMRISHQFLDFEEHWENVVRKSHFVEFARAFDASEAPKMPVHQQLLITYILAKTAEDALDFATDAVSVTVMAVASLDQHMLDNDGK